MPSIERIFSPRKKTDAGVHAWSDGHAVGIIAAPRGEEGNSFPVWYSADGVTFTPRESGTSRNLESVTFGKDLFVVVGDHAAIRNSEDGIEWF